MNIQRFKLKKIKEYSKEELIEYMKAEKSKEDTAYGIFCRCAASRCASQIKIFCEARKNYQLIKEELKNRTR